jgi:hypothetical protein
MAVGCHRMLLTDRDHGRETSGSENGAVTAEQGGDHERDGVSHKRPSV